jgi:hypothetical protein
VSQPWGSGDVRLRRRFWVELTLAAASAVFLLLTLLWKDWIEIVFGVDPDNHSGSLEWLIVVLSAITTLVAGGLARWEWRRQRIAAEAG